MGVVIACASCWRSSPAWTDRVASPRFEESSDMVLSFLESHFVDGSVPVRTELDGLDLRRWRLARRVRNPSPKRMESAGERGSEGLQAPEIVPLRSEPEGARLEAGLWRVNGARGGRTDAHRGRRAVG